MSTDKLSHLTAEERRDWELAQKATPGPWVRGWKYPHQSNDIFTNAEGIGIGDEWERDDPWPRRIVVTDSGAYPPEDNDALFICAARTGYPAALEQLSAARGEIARWKAIEKYLPPGFEIGDDATVELAVELAAAESRLRDLLEADVTRARDICRLTIERDQAEQEIDRLNTVERDLREKVGRLLLSPDCSHIHTQDCTRDNCIFYQIKAALLEASNG